ncbi:MAG: hypothetical protein QXP77_01350 [Candidatus Aenigmatarchaeota archaeon]
MKTQASLEYLIIVSIAFLILIPAILYANSMLLSSKNELRNKLGESVVERLAENSDWVYSLGSPSRIKINIYVPEFVEYINISNHKISLKFKDSPDPIFKITKANVTGYIPSEEGYYNVLIMAEQNFVNISVVE